MTLQVISVVGALAILAAYAANQFGWTDASNLLYQIANLVGSAILTVVAAIEFQLGALYRIQSARSSSDANRNRSTFDSRRTNASDTPPGFGIGGALASVVLDRFENRFHLAARICILPQR